VAKPSVAPGAEGSNKAPATTAKARPGSKQQPIGAATSAAKRPRTPSPSPPRGGKRDHTPKSPPTRARQQERGRQDSERRKDKGKDKGKAKRKDSYKDGSGKTQDTHKRDKVRAHPPSKRRRDSPDSGSYSYSSYYEDEEEISSSKKQKDPSKPPTLPIGARKRPPAREDTAKEDKKEGKKDKKPAPIGARKRTSQDDSRDRPHNRVRLLPKAKVVAKAAHQEYAAAAPAHDPRKGKLGKGVKARLRSIIQGRAAQEGKTLQQMQTELLKEAKRRDVTLQFLLEGRTTSHKDCVPFRFDDDPAEEKASPKGGSSSSHGHSKVGTKAKSDAEGAGPAAPAGGKPPCKEEMHSPSDDVPSMADFGRTPTRTSSPNPNSEDEKERSPPSPEKPDAAEDKKEEKGHWDITVSSYNLELFKDSHVLNGIPKTKLYSYGLYVPERARNDPELMQLYAVGGAILGPSCRPASSALSWGRDSDQDHVVQSCMGWLYPPHWSGNSFTLSSYAGVPFSTLAGQQMAKVGKQLCEALRHQEEGLDAAGYADFDFLVCWVRRPAWEVLACALWNWDHRRKMYRFEMHIEGIPTRHTLWPLSSPDMPRERGTKIFVRATRKHTVQLGY
jgi:hypothetical protein